MTRRTKPAALSIAGWLGFYASAEFKHNMNRIGDVTQKELGGQLNDTCRLNRRSFLGASAAAGAAWACGFQGLAFGVEGPHGPGLDASLELLTMWGEKPEGVIRLYSAIYNALAASPAATFKTVSEDVEVRRLCEEQGVVHFGGPMLGCIGRNSARVWVRTARPASVLVKVMVGGEEKSFGPVESTFASDLAAVVPVTGLAAGATAPYKVFVDGREVPVPENAAITTTGESDAPNARIVFGTCPHRWGLGNEKQVDSILKRKPDAMLLYGDIAVQDRKSNFAMHRADYALRDFHPAWQKLVGATPVYTSWDDHDYYANDAWGIPNNATDDARRSIRRIFADSWNNSYYGLGDEGGGIFHHTRIGPCDIIMTDNRYFREKEGKYCFLGKEQMEWLKKTLKACKGPFIIMSCGTMWSDFVSNGKDSWGKYDPDGREEIFSLIEEQKIGGVLLVSGDRHGARGFRIPRPSGFEFYEFEPASLGGRTGPAKTSKGWTTQLFGMAGEYAFGEFTFDASGDDPSVTYSLIRDTGDILYELTLKRSQLTPAAVTAD